jgi:hypothetical protein
MSTTIPRIGACLRIDQRKSAPPRQRLASHAKARRMSTSAGRDDRADVARELKQSMSNANVDCC